MLTAEAASVNENYLTSTDTDRLSAVCLKCLFQVVTLSICFLQKDIFDHNNKKPDSFQFLYGEKSSSKSLRAIQVIRRGTRSPKRLHISLIQLVFTSRMTGRVYPITFCYVGAVDLAVNRESIPLSGIFQTKFY